jgi:hypothetical protein
VITIVDACTICKPLRWLHSTGTILHARTELSTHARSYKEAILDAT